MIDGNTVLSHSEETLSLSWQSGMTEKQSSKFELYEEIAKDFSCSKEEEIHNNIFHTVSDENYDDMSYFVPGEICDNLAHADSKVTDLFPKGIRISQEPHPSFSVLQEWEGYVISISDTTFTARLTDITKSHEIEHEEADFLLDDLEDSDRRAISLGTIFRWIIGYRRSPGGTKDRLSRIVFRNVPIWKEKELNKNKHDAIEMAKQLNVE